MNTAILHLEKKIASVLNKFAGSYVEERQPEIIRSFKIVLLSTV